jgi:hypothetical protein
MTPPEESAQATLAQALLAQALFAPRSVAIVGQSNDAAKTAGRPLKFLRQAGYAGRIYPVNEWRDTVGLTMLDQGADPSNFTADQFAAAIALIQSAG